jgi:hypothetical protein
MFSERETTAVPTFGTSDILSYPKADSVYVGASVRIDYHQALKALENLVEVREALRFSEWDVQRLEGLVTAVKEKLHERTSLTASSGVCVK